MSADAIENLAELSERLGGVPLRRVRFRPPPGTATERDVLRVRSAENLLCELVDGVLVEKAAGFAEACLGAEIACAVMNFGKPRKLGLVTGAGGMLGVAPGVVRSADMAYLAWEQIPGGRLPREPIPHLAPTLAVEILRRENTEAEMDRKRREYFAGGTRLVWMVYPSARRVQVYTSAEGFAILEEGDTLDGGDVLPGFSLPLAEVFAVLDAEAPPPPKPKKRRKNGDKP